MKKTTLYIARHGQTDWNVQGKLQGHADIPLNKMGEQEAQDLAKSLENIPIDKIYSSDLKRTKKTAEIVAKKKKLSVHSTPLLRERTFGKFEGLSYEEFKKIFNKYYDEASKLSGEDRFNFRFHPQIESDNDVAIRAIPLLLDLGKKHPNNTILIVTHGALMRILLLKFGQATHKSKVEISNCSYIKVSLREDEFLVEETKGIVIN